MGAHDSCEPVYKINVEAIMACFIQSPLVMEIFSLCNISFLCLCTLVYYVYHYRRKQTLPFPPGLRRWPIVGNAFSIPLTYVHVFYKNLGERLGKCSYC